MITLQPWQAWALAWVLVTGGVCLGIGLTLWWQGVQRGSEAVDRLVRDYGERDRGSAYDGGLRGVRFIPLDRDDDG